MVIVFFGLKLIVLFLGLMKILVLGDFLKVFFNILLNVLWLIFFLNIICFGRMF